jgi:hypothetical protein
MTTDGVGGAIITWQDNRNDANGDIYAQRIDLNGNPLWGTNGILICNATGAGNDGQTNPVIASDGNGGAIITWVDKRTDNNGDIYAIRINSSGNAVSGWGTLGSGIVICNEPAGTGNSTQNAPVIVGDGINGAIIVWQDNRNDTDADIYAMRINSSGSVVSGWTSGGSVVCNDNSTQGGPVIASDGASGAIIAWMDYRNGSTPDIYAQRLYSDGTIGGGTWTSNGIIICNAGTDKAQNSPKIISDSSGGAIIVWRDRRTATTNWDIYAIRINSSGNAVSGWGTIGSGTGIVTNDTGWSLCINIAGDENGGVFISWSDGGDQLRAQYINSSGVAQWDTNGKLINPTGIYPYSNGVTAD